MADLKVDGVKSSESFQQIKQGLDSMSPEEKKAQIKKVNGIFQMNVKGAGDKKGTWTIDMKKEGTVYAGPAKPKADVTIDLSDETFENLKSGALNGQKAFMSGKIKVKGNIMLAQKLDAVLKTAKSKL